MYKSYSFCRSRAVRNHYYIIIREDQSEPVRSAEYDCDTKNSKELAM